MSAISTDRLELPFLDAGQAQKELTHNEALLLLDLLVQCSVKGVGRDAPPADPAIGDRWIIGVSPTGAWAGSPGALAVWTAGGWRIAPARSGMRAWSEADAVEARYRDGAWTLGVVPARQVVIEGKPVLGARRPAIADPAGGGVIDAEARAVIGSVLAAMREHGMVEG